MDAAADHDAAFPKRAQGRRHQRSHGGEDDRRIELIRRLLVGASGPDRAE
jgi:hypothetical protein